MMIQRSPRTCGMSTQKLTNKQTTMLREILVRESGGETPSQHLDSKFAKHDDAIPPPYNKNN